MKTIVFFLTFMASFSLLSQNNFSYQAVIRNASGELIVSKPITLKLSILRNSTFGSIVYSEQHQLSTNENGLISLLVGNGTNKTGNLSNMYWDGESYFIKTEIDPNNGNNFTIKGTSPITPVPYALKAKELEINPPLEGLSNVYIQFPNIGDVLSYDGNSWINSSTSSALISLDDLNDVDINFPNHGDFLRYNGQTWEPYELQAVEGGGSQGYITKWADDKTINESSIYQQSDGKININTAQGYPGQLNVTSNGGYGVYAESSFIGLYGTGGYGVYGIGENYGVVAAGGNIASLRVDGDAVFRAGSGSAELRVEGFANGNIMTSQGDLYIGTYGTLVLNGGGSQVGIGTNAPNALLTVNGTASKPGGGSWSTYSDARVKKNVSDYTIGLNEVLKIRPVSFQYNGKENTTDNGNTYVGVIAQEIEKIIPSTVTISNKGEINDLRTFDGSELTYAIINAIKELNEKLRIENEELKMQNEKLEQKVNSFDSFRAEVLKEIELLKAHKQ